MRWPPVTLIGPKDTTLGLLTFACCFSASSFLPESRTCPWLRHADRFWVPCCYIPSLSSKNLLQQLHHTLLVFNSLEAALKKKKKKKSKTLTRRSLLRSCQVLSLCICVSICTKMLYSEGDGQWEAAAWVLLPLPPPMRSFWSRQGCWSLSEVEDSRWRGTSWALRRAQSFWQTLLVLRNIWPLDWQTHTFIFLWTWMGLLCVAWTLLLFFKYLFIYLHWVLVAACEI